MRSASILLLCTALCGCAPQERPAASPPQMRDRVAELRAFDPTSPDARPNPQPDPAMLGCYTVTVRPQPQHPPFARIRLTAEPAGTFGLHQTYAVEPPRGSWRPYTHDEIRLNLGTETQPGGWSFSLRATAGGFEGPALWMTDAMDRIEAVGELRRSTCP